MGIYFYPAQTQKIYADTITRTSPDDECTRHIFLQIEIFTELDMTDGALETVADIWADQIDDRWNGPTDEQIHQAAEDINREAVEAGGDPEFDEGDLEDIYAGNLNAFPILQRIRQELEDRANEDKENATGGTNCAIINCCKIYFHTIIETRKPGDDPREGFDQVEVMEAGFRSFVRVSSDGLTGNQGGTSGRWAFEPGDSSAIPHEAGHVMGADDFYSDVEGEDGETHSESHEGHESDLMARRRGWPKAEHITEILRIAGKPCNCCRFEGIGDEYMVGLNLTDRFAMDALAGNNCEYLEMSKTALENRLRDLQVQRIPAGNKAATARQIQDRLDQINKALEDCDKPRPVTGTTGPETAIGLGTDGIPVAPFTFDSNICQYYGGGTIDLPITPWGPFIPVGPETPGTTPPTEPGTTPPTITPVTPGGTPDPGLIIPIPVVPVTPGEITTDDPGDTPTIPQEIIEMELTTTPPIVVTIPEDEEDDPTTPPVPVFIIKAEQTVIDGDQTRVEPVEGVVLKLGYPVPDLPLQDNVRTAEATDDQHDQEPRSVVTDEDGIGMIFTDGFESGDTSAWSSTVGGQPSQTPVIGARLDMTPTKSSIVYLTDPEAGGGQTELPESVVPYVADKVRFGDTWGITLSYKYNFEDDILIDLEGYEVEENHYRDKQTDDPYFNESGTWGQSYPDQWAIQRVGFVAGSDGAWAAAGDDLAPVVIAVIDTGLDWNHADFSWDNIWINEDEIPGNGIDDDLNGYKDDVIGWDFYTNTPTPWDQDGHGTFITGVIAATINNGIGIAGINPAARIMVLKALNDFGHTRASFLAKAIKYAVDNGARVINLSVGGKHLTRLEKLAVEYAYANGVIIVVAAGNDGSPVADYGLSPYDEVITVASTNLEDQRAFFSNLGPEIDVAAPGLDVLSLRARRTDFMRHIRNVPYDDGSAYVGPDKRYYRSSGTSFSAPIVSGIASLILAMNPDLTSTQVKRMIVNSARDIETPGRDQFTGHGLVDAVAALKADPAFEIVADISGIAVVSEDGQTFVAVTGTASANDFDTAQIFIGAGDNPASWQAVGGRITTPVVDAALVQIPADEFRTAPVWIIRIVVTHKNGEQREEWFTLSLG